jgi:trans-aconitate 2-methyltransferase
MPWNPATYNEFKDIRYRPFYDLVDMIDINDVQTVVDLGCGTGEQTAILSKRLPRARILGIDTSAEMLSDSQQFASESLRFQQAGISEFLNQHSDWDLIFSNAALQWENNHAELFPRIIARLSTVGRLAVQMPYQKENVLNKLLLELVREPPFPGMLNGFQRDSPLLTIDEYADILFRSGLRDIGILLKVYPIIAKDELELYRFIAGSALIPYLERLNKQEQEQLKTAYLSKIRVHFKAFPAIYSFKRLLMYGRK